MGTWGLLARFFCGMAVGIAAVALVMGCAAAAHEYAQESGVLAAGQERGSWASAGEVAWLQRLGVWETSLMRSLDRAAHAVSDADAELVAGPIRYCSHNLERQVGNPPTARLQHAADTLEQACAHLERAVDSKSAGVAEQEGRRGGEMLLRADQMMPPGEKRSIPVVA